MKRMILALILAMILAAPAAADDGDAVFSRLIFGEWSTVSKAGVPTILDFRGLDTAGRIGVVILSWTEWTALGDKMSRSRLLHFYVDSIGLIELQGGHHFVSGAGGWLWRVDRDTQTVEPLPD